MQLTFLNQSDLQAIHQATLDILSEIGIKIGASQAKDLLLAHGGNEFNGRVRLPDGLVEKALSYCPSQVHLRGRNGEVFLGDGQMHVHNLGGARDVLDPKMNQLRRAKSDDVADSARLLDALDNVTTTTPMYTPQDIPAHAMGLAMFILTIANTGKPINGPGVQNAREVEQIAQAIEVVLGERQAVSLAVSPISPLTFPADIADAILAISRNGIPFGPLPCPSLGSTAPLSLAGALAQQNAENLAAITLAQLANPGLPVVYCGRIAPSNLHTLSPAWGNPETGIISAATVQVGHYYRLPVNVYGLSCSSYSLDIQNGYERMLNALLPALAGVDELSGIGEMAGGVCSCPSQMVIDNEIVDMLRRVQRGFEVNPDSLGVDLIGRVMDGARNYLAEKHTVKYLREGEVWRSQLAVQPVSWDEWRARGETLAQRAQDRADSILEEHSVEPISPDQARALDELLQVVMEERW